MLSGDAVDNAQESRARRYRVRMMPSHTSARVASVLALLAVLIGATVGCGSKRPPSPTPTPLFASEEEAFAAAEETYSAYADATNATDLMDPATFEPVFAWLVESANESARKTYSGLHAEGLTRSGVTTFDSFTPRDFDGERIRADLCIDVSQVTVVDSSGASVVPIDRPVRQPVEVIFVEAKTSTNLAISSSSTSEALEC